MPLYHHNATITVVRQGRRLKVKPTNPPVPYDFTAEEVEAAESAGVVMTPYAKPTGPKAVDAGAAPEVTSKGVPDSTAAETPAEKKARQRAEEKAARESAGKSELEDEAL